MYIVSLLLVIHAVDYLTGIWLIMSLNVTLYRQLFRCDRTTLLYIIRTG
jgi:hypothetical protein